LARLAGVLLPAGGLRHPLDELPVAAGPRAWTGGRPGSSPTRCRGLPRKPLPGVLVGADRLDHPQPALGRMVKDDQGQLLEQLWRNIRPSATWSCRSGRQSAGRLAAAGRRMAPVGLGPAGQLQLLGQNWAGRPQHQLAALATGPGRHPGQHLHPGRVNQDHPAQVQHDVMVTLADQVTQVLPQLEGRIPSRSPRTVTMAWPSEGMVADCNSGAIAASLRRCGYWVATGRTLAAWGPF
jgi:hypothetical protein